MEVDEKQKLGEGGCSQVFKGLFRGEEVAVKRLLKKMKTFELNLLSSEIQHENIVRYITQIEKIEYRYSKCVSYVCNLN